MHERLGRRRRRRSRVAHGLTGQCSGVVSEAFPIFTLPFEAVEEVVVGKLYTDRGEGANDPTRAGCWGN